MENKHFDKLPKDGQSDLLNKITSRIADNAILSKEEALRRTIMDVDAGMEELPSAISVPISCKKGCSFCCHIHIDCSKTEAEILAPLVPMNKIARLEAQVRKTVFTWQELSPEDRKCVFLSDEGTCTVYDKRPLSCRKYVVISEPKLCDVETNKELTVQIIQSNDVEAPTIAFYLKEVVGSLPRFLLELLNNEISIHNTDEL